MKGHLEPRWRRRALYGLLALSPAVLVTAHVLERDRAAGLGNPGAGLRGGSERCLACHGKEAAALPRYHKGEAVGCSGCHLGNPLSFDKQRAHAGMEPFPGDLSTAWRSCGSAQCHPAVVARVQRSLMASPRGLLAVNRQAFGEVVEPTPSPGEWNRVRSPGDLLSPEPGAEGHARKLCASCHLATRHISAAARSRGGGCSACHLKDGPTDGAHPQLRLGVTPDACTGCHSRSGRVSLSYYGWHEGLAMPGHSPAAGSSGQPAMGTAVRSLPDGRLVRRARADVHARAGMGCLDCHTAVGLMGDGELHSHKEQQVDVACSDCHGRAGPARRAPLRPGEDAARRVAAFLVGRGWLRPPALGWPVPRTRRGTPLLALRPGPGGRGWVLHRRSDGRPLGVRPTPDDPAHSLRGHERLSCQACHTDWSHQCSGCHTKLEPRGWQHDSVTGALTKGRWSETPGPVLVDSPTLGVLPDGRIGPFVPGMPLCVTIEGDTRCTRLFAPADPHTTQRRSRSCASCHRSSLALGLWRGSLARSRGAWRFEAAPSGPPPGAHSMPIPPWEDGVPWDGWTSLEGTPSARATRRGARPLSPSELRRILEVGPCVECHGTYGDRIYRDFSSSLARARGGLAPRCLLGRGARARHVGPGKVQ